MLEGYIFTTEGDNFLFWSHSQQKWIEAPAHLVLSNRETLRSTLASYGVEPIPLKSMAKSVETHSSSERPLQGL